MDQKQVELQFALARLLQFKTLEKNETQFLKGQFLGSHPVCKLAAWCTVHASYRSVLSLLS